MDGGRARLCGTQREADQIKIQEYAESVVNYAPFAVRLRYLSILSLDLIISEGIMKKTIIALSALMLAAPVFAATTHATDETVAEAHKGADTAKEKLHQAQDAGAEQKLKAEHAAEGKSHATTSKVSEGTQKAWHSTKQGSETAWDKTKQGAEDLKNKATN